MEFETGAHPIVFPDDKQIQEYAEFLSRLDSKQEAGQVQATSTELALLLDIEKRDPLSEISEQEKELLWKFRNLCRDMPNILPRLLDAVKWQARDEVSQLYLLLSSWAQVSTQTSLELLDCKYADLRVRAKASHTALWNIRALRAGIAFWDLRSGFPLAVNAQSATF